MKGPKQEEVIHKFDHFSQERRKVIDEVMHSLQFVLEKVHQKNYSNRFWNLFARTYAVRFVSLNKAIFADDLTRVNNIKELDVAVNYPTSTESSKQALVRIIKQLLSFRSRLQWKKALAENQDIAIGFSNEPFYEAYVGSRLPDGLSFKVGERKKKQQLRQRLRQIIAEESPKTFLRSLWTNIPDRLLAGLELNLNEIPLQEPEKKQFHVHMCSNEFQKLILAKYSEAGAKIIWYQHGANYGEIKNHQAQLYETSVSDAFRTWGWEINPKDQAYYALRLEVFKQNYFKTTGQKENDLLICYPRIDDWNWTSKHFLATSEVIFKDLNFAKYPRVTARPRPRSRLFSAKSELAFLDKFESIHIDEGKISIPGLLRKSGVVIQLLYPSTNFLECLYVNHPTIALLGDFEATEIAQPYYDYFLSCGLMHRDAHSLVDFLNKVDLDTWWAGIIASKEYQSFKFTFARSIDEK